MKKAVLIPGILYILKEYHDGLVQVMKRREQTQAQAAEFLGISVPTFQKMLRLQWQLNFHSNWGQDLSNSLERWSGVAIDVLYPKAFFTREFVMKPKTHRKTLPLTLLMQGATRDSITLELTETSSSHPSPDAKPEKKKRNKIRKKRGSKKD